MNDRIFFSGHTMGAPGRDIYECIRLFREIGYDGIEVRVAPNGQIDSETITDTEALDAFRRLSEIEGIIPALESAHALAYLEKLMPKTKKDEVVVLCLSGRGDKDVQMVAKALGEEL